jgi:hypothetical protein
MFNLCHLYLPGGGLADESAAKGDGDAADKHQYVSHFSVAVICISDSNTSNAQKNHKVKLHTTFDDNRTERVIPDYKPAQTDQAN